MNVAIGDRDLLVDVQQFLYHEAALLDEGRFDEWLELFDDEALYFMPTREVSPSRNESVRRLGDLCSPAGKLGMEDTAATDCS